MENEESKNETNNNIKIISDSFKINLKNILGSGGYGQVFEGYDIKASVSVAIKVEKISKNNCSFNEFLALKKLNGGSGIPKVFGLIIGKKHRYLALEKLGENLENLFTKNYKSFKPEAIFKIGLQLIERIEFIHSKGFLHRDIKPSNIMIGQGDKKNIIYLTDFGLARNFFIYNTNKHIPFKNNKSFLRASIYGSLNCNKGFELSRRDDIESALFVIAYFLKKKLKWKELSSKDRKAKIKAMIIMKENLEELCKDLPRALSEAFIYVRRLCFEEKPNYSYLKRIFLYLIGLNEKEGRDEILFE